MCQCGCSEYPIEQAYELPDGVVVGVGIYHGCRNCHAGPAVDVSVFANRKTAWLEHARIKSMIPNEYGGRVEGWQCFGIPIPLFEVKDLVAACKESGDDDLGEDGCATVSEWLEENGLNVIQGAMRSFMGRMKEREKKREEGKP